MENSETRPNEEKAHDDLLLELAALMVEVEGGRRIKPWYLLRLRAVLIDTILVPQEGDVSEWMSTFKTIELHEKLAAE